jgi:hypothetical protein
MANAQYQAAMLDAESGGNESYRFEADDQLFSRPADDIVAAFIDHYNVSRNGGKLYSYELNSAVKKRDKPVVLATGALMLEKGELPFLLMISPAAP